jgi:hypothetical protein
MKSLRLCQFKSEVQQALMADDKMPRKAFDSPVITFELEDLLVCILSHHVRRSS